MARSVLNDMLIAAGVAVFVVCGTVLPGFADIYRYIDPQGVIYFSNTPTSSRFELYIKERSEGAFRSYSASPYERLINEASIQHQIPGALLKAIIKVESDYNPMAVSKKGAMGLMQIMPENFRHLKIKDPFNPRENIMGGARFFRQLVDRFEGKLPLAIAAYNAGPDAVVQHNRIPPIQETEDYVEKVMGYYDRFKTQ